MIFISLKSIFSVSKKTNNINTCGYDDVNIFEMIFIRLITFFNQLPSTLFDCILYHMLYAVCDKMKLRNSLIRLHGDNLINC